MFGVLSLFGGGKVIVPEVAVFKGVGRGFLAGRVAASWAYMVTRCVNHNPNPMKVRLNSEGEPE